MTQIGAAAESGCPGIHKTITVDGPSYLGGGIVVGDTLVLADGKHGITTWSIEDPDHPVQVGTFDIPKGRFPSSYDIKMRADESGTVYVRTYFGPLWALDIKDPKDPKPLWRSDLLPDPLYVKDFDVRGSKLVVASAPAVEVFDVQSPVNPVPIGEAGILGIAVAITDNHIVTYSMGGTLEVFTIDGNNPPERLQSIELSASDSNPLLWASNDLVVLEDYFVSGAIDLSAGPELELTRFNPGLGWTGWSSVAFDTRKAYAAVWPWQGDPHIEVLDFADPTQPALVDSVPGWGLPVLGEDRLYRLDRSEVAIHSLDEGLPVAGYLPPFGAAEKLLFDGEMGILADGLGGLAVFDFHDPDDPVELGRVRVDGWVDDVAIAGGHAFLAADEAGFVVVDIRDPSAPHVVAQQVYDNAEDVAVDGDLALVTQVAGGSSGAAWLEVFDIADPKNPQHLASVAGADEARSTSVVAEGGIGYFGSNSSVQIVDLASATGPAVLSSMTVTLYDQYNHRVEDLALSGDRLLAACGDSGLVVIDVADPIRPVIEHRIDEFTYTVGTESGRVYSTLDGKITAVDLDRPGGWRTYPFQNLRSIWAITPWRDRLYLASPPFIEVMSLECDAPVASFEWRSHGGMVWFTNTSSGWWEEIDWFIDAGIVIDDERDPMYYFEDAGDHLVTLSISGANGSSHETQTITISEPAPAPRRPDGRGGD